MTTTLNDGRAISLARTAFVSVSATIFVAFPSMLIGAFSALMQADLGIDEERLGTGVSVYFLSAAISSVVGGRLVERIMARAAVRAGVLISGLALLTMGLIARQWWHVLIALGVGGMATGLIHPSVNLVLARQVRPELQGVMFGAKQAAVPAATLLAGFAVPLFFGLGWRWAFIVAASMALLVALLVPSWPGSPAPAGTRRLVDRSARRPIVLAAIGGAFASGAANAMAIFFVLFSVSIELHVGVAATILAGASAAGILARIGAGIIAGRMQGTPFKLAATLIVVGSLGMLLISVAESAWLVTLGLVLGFVAGWGWPGVMLLAVVQANPSAPAASSGIVQGATFFGAIIGPSVFGFLAANSSYTSAWQVMAAGALIGGGFVALAAWTARWLTPSRSSAMSRAELPKAD